MSLSATILDTLRQEFWGWLFYTVGAGLFATGAQTGWRYFCDRRWRGWNLEIVRPDGTRVDAMKLSVDEVRNFEESEFERIKWIKSAVSNYGTLIGIALRELENAGWFVRDKDRRTYIIDLSRAVRSGHVRPHREDSGPERVDGTPKSVARDETD